MTVIDLETTGFNPQMDEILEIGAIRVVSGGIEASFTRRVKPSRYVLISVQRLTGITNEALTDCPDIQTVLTDFHDWLGVDDVMGYNLDFDWRFLCWHGKKHGLDFTLNGRRKGVDVLKCVRMDYKLDSYKLGRAAVSLGIPTEVDRLHMASYDAWVCYEVYKRCKTRKPERLDKSRYGTATMVGQLDLE